MQVHKSTALTCAEYVQNCPIDTCTTIENHSQWRINHMKGRGKTVESEEKYTYKMEKTDQKNREGMAFEQAHTTRHYLIKTIHVCTLQLYNKNIRPKPKSTQQHRYSQNIQNNPFFQILKVEGLFSLRGIDLKISQFRS